MISRWARTWITGVYRPGLLFLHRRGFTASMLSVGSVLFAIFCGVLIAAGWWYLAALGLFISGLLDSLDGELARTFEQPSRLGDFLDSVLDHYGDFAIYLGLLVYALVHTRLDAIWLVFITMFGSLIGSQIRSRAGMVGIDVKNTGFFTRLERGMVLMVALLTGWIVPCLWFLAVMNNLSAFQRLFVTIRLARNPS